MYLKFRYFVFLFVLIICIPIKSFAQKEKIGRIIDSNNETNGVIADTTSLSDSASANLNKKSDNFIDTKVVYNASDSIVLSSDSKKVFLYTKAKIEYGDIILEADYIEYDQERNFVFARGVEDTLGNLLGKPKFTEKSDEFIARTIKYNFKTKKGYIEDVFTEEEQGFLHSAETKKLADNSLLLKNGKYTTCDNEEHPHFYLKMSEAKVIPNDKIISGPAYMVMHDIPIKVLGVPFVFFPNQSEYSSGIMIPKYGEEKNRGFFLQDGGYYFGISDKMDLAVTGDIFSNGSWGSDIQFKFKKRYKFNSNFNFSYAEFIKSEEGLPDYSKTKNMAIRWTHTQDAKANPNSNFSASVNYSTSSFDEFNSKTLDQRATNTKQSNISYGKDWPGSPFRFKMNLKHSQNSNTNNVSLTLPVMTFNMDRQNPFRRKNPTGDTKWYEDIEIQYSSKLENRITTADTLLFHGTEFSDFENGFHHNIPLSTNFKILNHFNLSPRLEYTGILYPNYVKYTSEIKVDTAGHSYVDIDTINQPTIKYAHLVKPSISLSVGPNMYGMYQFKNPDSRVIAIRHVITPSASVSYTPDLGSMVDGYYDTYYTDTLKNTREYSIFENGIYRLPAAPGQSGSINFGLSNNLEMKVRNDEDTTGSGTKKIKLLESFKLSTSYNIFADSLNWSKIKINGRTSMFNNKLNFNFGATVDPYALNESGKVYNEFQWNTDDGGIGRLERVDFSLDVKLNSKKETGSGDTQSPGKDMSKGDRFSQDQYMYDMQEQVVTYVDFDIPWNLGVNYKFVYSKPGFEDSKKITQTMSLSGNISLTKKWKISFRANYDLVENKLSNASLNLHRDLHCWEASFSWIPVGYMQSYTFQINVTGSVLGDLLKYDKRESWQDNL
ncbi:MAG: LPS-assembly protein LptD [Bacteroidales bacterium]|nr:LPS-assembly protein LptD [Bacteroidales bacterium]